MSALPKSAGALPAVVGATPILNPCERPVEGTPDAMMMNAQRSAVARVLSSGTQSWSCWRVETWPVVNDSLIADIKTEWARHCGISGMSSRKLQGAFDHACTSLDLFSATGPSAAIVLVQASKSLYVTWAYEQRRDGNAVYEDAVAAYLADRAGHKLDHHLAAKMGDYKKYSTKPPQQPKAPQPSPKPSQQKAENGPRGAPRQ